MRYYTFDIIRLISFAAIVWWHYAYAMWAGGVSRNPLASESLLWHSMGQVSLFLAFSGFSVIVLSSFLTGLVGRKVQQFKFIAFFIVGWALFTLVGRLTYGLWFFEWDIYPFLIISFLSLRVFQFFRSGAVLLVAAGVGCIVSLIPFWRFDFFNTLHPLAKAVLVGSSQGEALGQWPVLPFIGLVWCFYGLGRYLKTEGRLLLGGAQVRGRPNQSFLPWQRAEFFVWPVVLGAGALCLGAHMGHSIDVYLDAKLYRLPPYQLWGQLLWVVFFMRLGLLQKVQEFLARQSWVQWVGQLQVSKNFWAMYVVHYLVIFLLVYGFRDVVAYSVWGSFVCLLLVPVLSEQLVRAGQFLIRLIRRSFI